MLFVCAYIIEWFLANYDTWWAQIKCHIYTHINTCYLVSGSLNLLMKLRYHIIVYLICIRWLKPSLMLCVCECKYIIHRKIWPKVGSNEKVNFKCNCPNELESIELLYEDEISHYIIPYLHSLGWNPALFCVFVYITELFLANYDTRWGSN